MSEIRTAIVTGGANSLEQLQRYMPENYKASAHYVLPVNKGGTGMREMQRGDVFIITGKDVAGWTMDGYVLPRLASGLIFAEEVMPD